MGGEHDPHLQLYLHLTIDIDECLLEGACLPDETCVNTPGSFSCTQMETSPPPSPTTPPQSPSTPPLPTTPPTSPSVETPAAPRDCDEPSISPPVNVTAEPSMPVLRESLPLMHITQYGSTVYCVYRDYYMGIIILKNFSLLLLY